MEVTSTGSIQNIFVYANQQSYQLESLANEALKNGIDLYVNKDYKGAIKEFKRAIGLNQNSPYAADAAHYMAQAHLMLDDKKGAIKAYQASIRLNPYRDDSHNKLGNLYFAENRLQDATREYEAAVALNPDATNLFTLAQVYLNTDRFMEAEAIFNKVNRMMPRDPAGKYGLGLTYSRQERYEDAIRMFKDAVAKKDDFYDAYAEMGYAYADLGDMDKAAEMVSFLKDADEAGLAEILDRYMYKVDPPKIMFAYSSSTFSYLSPPKTPVVALDAYLATANASKTFTMTFQFDKEMQRASVENIANWRIGRSTQGGPAKAYNFGMSVPSTEVSISPLPASVYYDAEKMTATVYFKVQQNATADGTIDPSHIEFKFAGKDIYENSMDADFDQFTGFSKVA